MDTILDDLVEHSKKLLEERKFAAVIDMFTTWLKEADESGEATSVSKARALNNRGHAKYMQVDFDRAVEDYDRAVELDPTLAAARYNRATIKYRMGKFPEALLDFEAACQMEPDNGEFAEGMAECKRAFETSK